jgi:hypothetical protein
VMCNGLLAQLSEQHDRRRHHCHTGRGQEKCQRFDTCSFCECQLCGGVCPNCGDEPRIRRGQATSSPSKPEPPLIRLDEKDLAGCICRTARASA